MLAQVIKKYPVEEIAHNIIPIYIRNSNIYEATRGAAARSMTVKPTGCGFDPHSRR